MLSTEWNIVQFLRNLYNFFKNSPARRGEFTKITKCSVFPKKFCAVRWLENGQVAQTALEILPQLRQYAKYVSETKSHTTTAPSFILLKESLDDSMLGPKIAFFKSLALDAEPFLREFQSSWPLVPFLYTGLNNLIQEVMKRFVKPDKVKLSMDLDNEENLLSFKKVEIGFLARSEINKLEKPKDIDIASFRNKSKKAMKVFVKKLLERSPV